MLLQVVGIENEDIPKFKLMLNGLLRCPVTVESLSHSVRPGDVIGKLDVHWGRNSFRENVLKAKVKLAVSLSDSSKENTEKHMSFACRVVEPIVIRIILFSIS